jgi:hypothetical protein
MLSSTTISADLASRTGRPPTLRPHSFLSRIARPHYTAVRRCGVAGSYRRRRNRRLGSQPLGRGGTHARSARPGVAQAGADHDPTDARSDQRNCGRAARSRARAHRDHGQTGVALRRTRGRRIGGPFRHPADRHQSVLQRRTRDLEPLHRAGAWRPLGAHPAQAGVAGMGNLQPSSLLAKRTRS